jgi:hypothetical protein
VNVGPKESVTQFELKMWTTQEPNENWVHFYRQLVFKGTSIPPTREVLEALHSRGLATGYYVKAKMSHLDTCRLEGLPYGGLVTAVNPTMGIVTVSTPGTEEGQRSATLPLAKFLDTYEVD